MPPATGIICRVICYTPRIYVFRTIIYLFFPGARPLFRVRFTRARNSYPMAAVNIDGVMYGKLPIYHKNPQGL